MYQLNFRNDKQETLTLFVKDEGFLELVISTEEKSAEIVFNLKDSQHRQNLKNLATAIGAVASFSDKY